MMFTIEHYTNRIHILRESLAKIRTPAYRAHYGDLYTFMRNCYLSELTNLRAHLPNKGRKP